MMSFNPENGNTPTMSASSGNASQAIEATLASRWLETATWAMRPADDWTEGPRLSLEDGMAIGDGVTT
jgi:hypothetical protein